MNNINRIFFELIQVALCNRMSLSYFPTAEEWKQLYDMAGKQSLLGICFVGMRKLQTRTIPRMLYLKWLGMAAIIQQRNEVVNRQCAELTKMFGKDGFDAVILKGQSVAGRYGDLAPFRQSGDIDVWLTGYRKQIKDYITKNYKVGAVIYNHAHVNIFADTEVEVHFYPSWLYSPLRNRHLQRWFRQFQDADGTRFCRFEQHDGFKSPSLEFDLVFLLLHAYRHLMHEGLSLRQIMDYYVVLRSITDRQRLVPDVQYVLRELDLLRFAGAMMYVIATVFDMPREQLICEPDEKRGQRLLAEIIIGDNLVRRGDCTSHIGYTWRHLRRPLTFLKDYSSEVLWSPFWKVWHFAMRKSGII